MSPTAMVILMTEDSTDTQYKDLVLSLPDSTNNVEIIYKTVNFRVLIANVNDCDITRLWDDPIVETMGLEGPYVLDDEADGVLEPTKRDSFQKVRQQSNNTSKNISNVTADVLRPQKALLDPLIDLQIQEDSPWHLKLLSGLSHQVGNGLSGLFYDFQDYLYADRSLSNDSPTSDVKIYIFDTGIRGTHEVSTRNNFTHHPLIYVGIYWETREHV